MAHNEDLLQRPLYIYDLPEELLTTLTSKDDAPTQSEPQPVPTTTPSDIPATNCTICSFTAHTVGEQRTHTRSDLHKLNMKRKIRGQRILNETEFERMLADIDEAESISGSEDNSSESDEVSGEDKKRRGVNPTSNTTKSNENDEEDEVSFKNGTHKTPLFWLRSSLLPSTVSLGIYRALLPPTVTTSPSEIPYYLAQKQLRPAPNSPQNPPHFFLCMIGGGHFAAMVISLLPTSPSHKPGERTATVLAHKTFHRYTTRRKQGGTQSANDNAKGNAHSAGSSLRRYNEAELNKDIRELLASWKEQWIDTAELLFIRAAGTLNRRTIFHYEGAVLNTRDARIRGFPFSTRRATQSELMRAFVELTRVKISRVSSNSLFSSNQSLLERPKPTTTTTATAPGPKGSLKPTAQERLLLDHTTTLAALIRRSKVPPLLTYLTSSSLTANFTFYPPAQHFHAPTPLHLASSVNSAACVSALLTKADGDPTILSSEGKTPYDLAGDRATRTAFRLARSELGEDRFDWNKARVPAPLTLEDVRLRDEREAAERLAREEREKERRVREVARLKKEEEERVMRERRNNALRTGGGGVLLGSRREREVVGMTPEMRMRLERERRARAAEARIRGMQGGAGAGGVH
ncbi:ankyrin repeat and zinc finger domain-containing protein [Tirmania nivea]|nr:ankyrin repeat and zinc finger domain-containing protein [Tirmania nivea]